MAVNVCKIDKFSDLKNLNVSKETKIYRHSWKQRAKISITAKFEEEIFLKWEYYGHAKFAHFVHYCMAQVKSINACSITSAEMGVQSLPPYK